MAFTAPHQLEDSLPADGLLFLQDAHALDLHAPLSLNDPMLVDAIFASHAPAANMPHAPNGAHMAHEFWHHPSHHPHQQYHQQQHHPHQHHATSQAYNAPAPRGSEYYFGLQQQQQQQHMLPPHLDAVTSYSSHTNAYSGYPQDYSMPPFVLQHHAPPTSSSGPQSRPLATSVPTAASPARASKDPSARPAGGEVIRISRPVKRASEKNAAQGKRVPGRPRRIKSDTDLCVDPSAASAATDFGHSRHSSATSPEFSMGPSAGGTAGTGQVFHTPVKQPYEKPAKQCECQSPCACAFSEMPGAADGSPLDESPSPASSPQPSDANMRVCRRREPQRADFLDDETFNGAWHRWRRLRDKNNMAVKRSRDKRKSAKGVGSTTPSRPPRSSDQPGASFNEDSPLSQQGGPSASGSLIDINAAEDDGDTYPADSPAPLRRRSVSNPVPVSGPPGPYRGRSVSNVSTSSVTASLQSTGISDHVGNVNGNHAAYSLPVSSHVPQGSSDGGSESNSLQDSEKAEMLALLRLMYSALHGGPPLQAADEQRAQRVISSFPQEEHETSETPLGD